MSKKVFKFLLIGALFLFVMGVIANGFKFFYKDWLIATTGNDFQSLIEFFDINNEGNLPAWFSSINLFISSKLLFVIYKIHDKQGLKLKKYWLTLSLLFLFLSIDEACSLHEMLNYHLKIGAQDGFFFSSWVAMGSILTLIIGTSYINFLIKIPTYLRNLFVLSGTIFITGALGLEILAKKFSFIYHNTANVFSIYLSNIEEFCEMFGIIVFIYALLVYINKFVKLEY